MKIKKGDNVKVISGKDLGKTGVVLRSLPASGKIVIDGINMFKKHSRPRKQGEKGQVVEVARPFNASNVQLVCPSCKKITRIGSRIEGSRKVRFCKKCKSTL